MIYTFQKRPIVLIRDKHIFSSHRVLHKDCDSKGSVEKILCSSASTGLAQDELIGGKLSVVE
jgi:hypothetical protein